jgi:tRNA(Ile)-lysidine synthase
MLTLPSTLLRPGDRACVALSGGADSTALLLLLHAANTQTKTALGIVLSAIHVNHNLRGEESAGDQTFCEELCRTLGVELQVRSVQTLERVESRNQSLEEAARELRYEAFADVMRARGADVVLTAHTLEDQAETVLMKLLRGAWLEGLSAIAPVLPLAGGRVMRPLLATRREDLRAYLRERDQAWREDSSNADEAFTRNRLRSTVLPLLRVENPQLDFTLSNLAELAREDDARWTADVARVLPSLVLPGRPVRGGGRANSTAPGAQALAMELERLRALDPALRRRVIRAAARQLGVRLSFAETTRILTLAGFAPGPPEPAIPAKAGGRLQLSGNLLAERSPRELRLSVG